MSLQKNFSAFLISSLCVCPLAFCDEDHNDHEDRGRDEISYEERGLQGNFQGRPLRPNAPNPEPGPNPEGQNPERLRPRGYNDNIHIQEGPYNEGGYRTREHVQAAESQAAESPMQEQRMYNQQQQQNQQQIP